MIRSNNTAGFLKTYLLQEKFDDGNTEISLNAAITEVNQNVIYLRSKPSELKKYLSSLIKDLTFSKKNIEAGILDNKKVRVTILKSFIKEVKFQIKSNQLEEISTLKWKGSPALLGAFINELIDKDYIEMSIYKSEANYSQIARICFDFFEVDTTIDNFIKEVNPNSNTLSEAKRAKIRLANRIDLK